MKLRIICRYSKSDANGQLVGFEFKTEEFNVPDNSPILSEPWLPEVIGGEWIKEEKNQNCPSMALGNAGDHY